MTTHPLSAPSSPAQPAPSPRPPEEPSVCPQSRLVGVQDRQYVAYGLRVLLARTADVDLISRNAAPRVGELLEMKLMSTPTVRHAQHLMRLRDRLGQRFSVGLVIHAGTQTLPLGERLWAVPVSAIWRSD